MNDNNQKPTRKFVARIARIFRKSDVNGNNYLILEVDGDNPIFVFPSKVEQVKWDGLKENQGFEFTCEEGRNSNNLLISFKEINDEQSEE